MVQRGLLAPQSLTVFISFNDHIYTTHPENVSECFVPLYSLRDHYPICFSRKIGCNISKNEHKTTMYGSFKTFNESQFLPDLAADMEPFSNLSPESDINKDCTAWYSAIQRQLDRHAPLKTKRVKSKRLLEWFNQEMFETRKLRDRSKQIGNWSDYKQYRNKTKDLMRRRKKQHFFLNRLQI